MTKDESAEIRPAYDDTADIKELFGEYMEMLFERDPEFRKILCFQGYGEEVEHVNEVYGPPGGRLYIARAGGRAAGCIALKRINRMECEMKRLFVRPEFRGRGIGKALVDLIIKDAGEIGYETMLLDTMPVLEEAINLYENAGFYRVPAYNDNPADGTIFLRYDIKQRE